MITLQAVIKCLIGVYPEGCEPWTTSSLDSEKT